MKKLILLPIFIFCFAAGATEDVTISKTKYSTSYIPRGFDSNDFVQFVAEGFFRDTCSRWAWTDVKVDHQAKIVYVTPMEYRYQGPCLELIVPHNEVINVGILKVGNYKVVQADGSRLGDIIVQESRVNTPDDYLYAPVSQAYAYAKNGRLSVTISGAYTNECYRLGQIASVVEPNVIVIQPMTERLYPFVPCRNGRFTFEKSVEVKGVKPGRYLLHVRSLDGKSINTIFDMN